MPSSHPQEAGVDCIKIGQVTKERKVWRSLINEKMKHLENWKREKESKVIKEPKVIKVWKEKVEIV